MIGEDEFLAALYAGVARDDAFRGMLELLAHRFGCRSSVLLYLDMRKPEMDISCCFGPFEDPVVQKRYQLEYAAFDPAPAAMASMRLGTVASTAQLFSRELHETNPFVRDFYRPLGFEETLGGPFARGDQRFGIVAVHRGNERPPFDQSDVQALERLMPHIVRAVELRNAFFQLERQVDTLQAAMDPLPAPTMIFDAAGVLRFANKASRAILARGDGLALDRSGRLMVADPDARSAMLQTLARQGRDSAIIRVPRTPDKPPYILRIGPLDVRHREFRPEGRYLAVISDPDVPVTDAGALLAAAFGLTPACARLAAALAQGQDLQTYAESSGITMNTAKSHLKTAFAATGTRRQVDLVRAVSAVLRDLQAW